MSKSSNVIATGIFVFAVTAERIMRVFMLEKWKVWVRSWGQVFNLDISWLACYEEMNEGRSSRVIPAKAGMTDFDATVTLRILLT